MTTTVTRAELISALGAAQAEAREHNLRANRLRDEIAAMRAAEDEPCTEEPPAGSVVIDRYGDAWQHDERGYWFHGEEGRTWRNLVDRDGPLRLVYTPDAAKEA